MLDSCLPDQPSYCKSYCMTRSQPISDTTIRNIKPGDPRKRLSDGAGLYLLLFVKGGSHGWRLDYTVNGRRKTISLGTYPATTIKLAREKAEAARQSVAAGVDPSEQRQADKAERVRAHEAQAMAAAGQPVPGSFEHVAREWYAVKRGEWSASYGDKLMRRLEVDVFPWIGTRPTEAITPPELLAVLRRIEARGVLETAHRARDSIGQVFRYAVATGRATSDPARDLRGALRRPQTKHMAAITDPAKLAELLRAVEGYAGSPAVRIALRLAPLLMLRPGELRFANWGEFDLAAGTWKIPPQRMKRRKDGKANGEPHLVPLPRQAVALLAELAPLTGPAGLVFPGERDHDRPMSENTVNAALRRMGFDTQAEITGHGFRATARTMLAERLGWDADVIEAQLAHSVKDALGRAYNRTQFHAQRRQMLQAWADYLDTLRTGGNVVPLPQRAGSGG